MGNMETMNEIPVSEKEAAVQVGTKYATLCSQRNEYWNRHGEFPPGVKRVKLGRGIRYFMSEFKPWYLDLKAIQPR